MSENGQTRFKNLETSEMEFFAKLVKGNPRCFEKSS